MDEIPVYESITCKVVYVDAGDRKHYAKLVLHNVTVNGAVEVFDALVLAKCDKNNWEVKTMKIEMHNRR
jgi:hypothetical protein